MIQNDSSQYTLEFFQFPHQTTFLPFKTSVGETWVPTGCTLMGQEQQL